MAAESLLLAERDTLRLRQHVSDATLLSHITVYYLDLQQLTKTCQCFCLQPLYPGNKPNIKEEQTFGFRLELQHEKLRPRKISDATPRSEASEHNPVYTTHWSSAPSRLAVRAAGAHYWCSVSGRSHGNAASYFLHFLFLSTVGEVLCNPINNQNRVGAAAAQPAWNVDMQNTHRL